jgi:membrane fusion protein, multidrug efflux system
MAEADPELARKSAVAPPLADPRPRRNWGRVLLMLSVPLLIAAAGLYYWMTSGRTVATDNAYVKRDIVSLSADVGGRIVDVRVKENQLVKRGDILFAIDPEPYRVQLAQANAQIASAQVHVGQLGSDYAATSVDINAAREDVRYAQQNLERQRALSKDGWTTKERLQDAEHALANAQEKLRVAQAEADKARSALATGATVPGVNPAIAAAMAQRAQAALSLERTVVRAPVSGRVSKTERLQVGQMMLSALPALSIVSSERNWIIANFKETDLARMKLGQTARIALDAYPDLDLTGHIESIGAGTGSEFSVLPAQNGNGNWVKVTQRVPVRIAIDGTPDRELIAGLSARVTVTLDKSEQRVAAR